MSQETKEIIKQWILSIENEQSIPDEIVALNFGLYEEPYAIDLTGAEFYDENDDDWACEEDYVPDHRTCPPLHIFDEKNWETVLDEMASILKEIIHELPHLHLWKATYITIGFCDGDLKRVK